MKKKSLVILAACIMLASQAHSESVTFGKALQENLIGFDVDPGGDGQRNMKIKIKSRGKNKMVVKLEPGRIFYADMNNIQPYVVTRPSMIALEPGETEEVLLNARCGNASAGTPKKDVEFSKTAMGPKDLVETLTQMNQYRVTDRNFFQSVVWHYTNNHSISAIQPGQTDTMVYQSIVKGICLRDNKQKANYNTIFKPSESGDDMQFSGVVDKISAKMNVVLENPADLKVALVNSNGETVKIIGFFMNQPSGQFNLPVNLSAEGIAHGDYSINLTDQDNKTLDQIQIQI